MESWIGVLGTILGVLVGGVTTFFGSSPDRVGKDHLTTPSG